MKNIYTLLLAFITIFATTTSITSCHTTENKDSIPALLERKKVLGPENEKILIKTDYDKAIKGLKDNPEDLKQYITLASVFITEGRITGNANYYSNAAVKMLNKIIESNTANKDLMFQAYSLKSAVELNMHQFKDALATAQQGVQISQYNSGIWGALVDANVELGNYTEAVKDCDQMLGLRPDLRSYSRASYLRQIYGQNSGAIAAMKMAVDAGVPGAESTEWARVNLGDLYLYTGNIDSADIEYRTSLVYRPGYAYAIMGQSKIERAKKNYDSAIVYAKQAITILSEAAFVSYLGDLYELKGDAQKAKDTRDDVIDLMEQGKKEEASDALVKHNVSREMAMAYMNAGKLDKALEYATTDLNMRPDNIDANNLIAWIYFLKHDYANAKIHADKMLMTNTKNATTLYEAGVIYAAAGDATKGDQLKQQATTISPYIDQRVINQSGGNTVASK